MTIRKGLLFEQSKKKQARKPTIIIETPKVKTWEDQRIEAQKTMPSNALLLLIKKGFDYDNVEIENNLPLGLVFLRCYKGDIVHNYKFDLDIFYENPLKVIAEEKDRKRFKETTKRLL